MADVAVRDVVASHIVDTTTGGCNTSGKTVVVFGTSWVGSDPMSMPELGAKKATGAFVV